MNDSGGLEKTLHCGSRSVAVNAATSKSTYVVAQQIHPCLIGTSLSVRLSVKIKKL